MILWMAARDDGLKTTYPSLNMKSKYPSPRISETAARHDNLKFTYLFSEIIPWHPRIHPSPQNDPWKTGDDYMFFIISQKWLRNKWGRISIRYENLNNKYHLHFRDDYFVFRDSSLDMISGDNYTWISILFHTCTVVLCVGFSTCIWFFRSCRRVGLSTSFFRTTWKNIERIAWRLELTHLIMQFHITVIKKMNHKSRNQSLNYHVLQFYVDLEKHVRGE